MRGETRFSSDWLGGWTCVGLSLVLTVLSGGAPMFFVPGALVLVAMLFAPMRVSISAAGIGTQSILGPRRFLAFGDAAISIGSGRYRQTGWVVRRSDSRTFVRVVGANGLPWIIEPARALGYDFVDAEGVPNYRVVKAWNKAVIAFTLPVAAFLMMVFIAALVVTR